MTVGNKIQEYRKALGLSQEELGQKLLVSRQTVSLWENDQTLPSIDNLTRLKEIFGVSVDELLGMENAAETGYRSDGTIELPLEKYDFIYSEKECREAYAAYTQYRRLIYRPLILLITLLIIVALEFPAWCVFFYVVFLVFSCAFSLVNFFKIKKREDDFVCNSIQYSTVVKVYDEYVESCSYKDGKIDRLNKLPFSQFKAAKDTGGLITALNSLNNGVHIFRKSDLQESSLIYSKLNIKDCTPKKRKLKLCSLLLFVFSIVSVFAGALCVAKLPDYFNFDIPPFWILFLFLPIPIISIYFGFSTKRTVGRYTKNIVVGIIISVLLLALGSFSFVLNRIYSNELSIMDKCVYRIEEYTGIAIPEYEFSSGKTNGDEGVPFENGIFYGCFTFELHPDKSNKFEETLINDSRWIENISSDLEELILTDDDFVYHYLLMYNVDTGQINALPEKSGTYEFLVIFYNTQADKMLVYEYDINYVK